MVFCPSCMGGHPKRLILAKEIHFCGRTGKRVNSDGIIRSSVERYRCYRCPRCMIVFHTRERLHSRDNSRNRPDSEAIKRYDENSNIPLNKSIGRTEVSLDVQDLILKTFGNDIIDDIESATEERSQPKRK